MQDVERWMADVKTQEHGPILIVDDEPVVAEATRRHIVAHIPGVEVLVCTDAEVALQVVAASEIAVLLCDLRMPVFTGTEILAEAHRRNPCVVSILVTAHATKEALLEAVNEGHVWKVIEKPWRAEVLCDAVAGALALHARRSASRPDAAQARPQIRFPPASPAPAAPPRRPIRIVVSKPGPRPTAASPAPRPGAAAAARPTFAPQMHAPRVAARYTDLQLLSQGGLGAVYRAHDSLLKIPVALKVIAEPFAKDPKVLEVLVAEARDAVQLSHPNIVRLHTLDQTGDQVYLVMEFIDGATLRRVLSHSGKVAPAAVAGIAAACASALAYAHGRRVHHLDLKPDNLMIDTKRTLRIIDFGLGCLASLAKPEDDILGTPFYMSPEQSRGEPPNPRMDIYSLGITLHELLTGVLPDHSGTTMPADSGDYRPAAATELPPDVRAVLNLSFALDPADRFQTAPEFADAFRRAVAATSPRN